MMEKPFPKAPRPDVEPIALKPKQRLIDLTPAWEEHWQGMPEFVQEELRPYQTINVHFENKEDLLKFSELVGQKITPNTRFIWYPKVKIKRYMDKAYFDES